MLLRIIHEIICINHINHLAQGKAQSLCSVCSFYHHFLNIASPAMLSWPNPLAFWAFVCFCFAVLPLIISSSYSKVHRLYVLAGDTEIEMNICWRSTLVERSGGGGKLDKKRNWIAIQAIKALCLPPPPGGKLEWEQPINIGPCWIKRSNMHMVALSSHQWGLPTP